MVLEERLAKKVMNVTGNAIAYASQNDVSCALCVGHGDSVYSGIYASRRNLMSDDVRGGE